MHDILDRFAKGELTREQACEALQSLGCVETGCARLDTGRLARTGQPEVVFCAGKTPDQVLITMRELHAAHGRTLGTHADPEQFAAVQAVLPNCSFDPVSRLLQAGANMQPEEGMREVVVISAGTADLPVAEEAAKSAEFLGCRVVRLQDCGVAGLHRLLSVQGKLKQAGVVIAVAGMDGALASVLGGLCPVPVVAVPTSVGYGAAFEGLAPLLSMLNACAPGVAVVNIDNGFGAAAFAARIVRGKVFGEV
mgnify:CR=1 FL=1